jgi:competence protein ComK
LLVQKRYIIEETMILMMGEYNSVGKLCTRVMAGNSTILVDRTPLQVLDETLTFIGFDLRGATVGAHFVIDRKVKCPVIVNPYLGICLFPTKSPHKADCMWFNPEHIVKTKSFGNNTVVELSNGYSIAIDEKLSLFNDKIQKAQQLMRLSIERGSHPDQAAFNFENKQSFQLSKEKSGKYNFDSMVQEQDDSTHP